MKKNLVAVAIVLAILVAGAAFFISSKKAQSPASQQAAAPNGSTAEEDDGAISSIRDAMGLGKKMQCTYADASDGKTLQSVVMIDGKRFKSVIDTPEGKMSIVFDGETQYVWNDKDKSGFKMSQACLDDVEKSLPENLKNNESFGRLDDITEDFDTAQDVSCRPALSIDTSVPADISFVDQCEMMRQSLDVLKGMNLPDNVQVPNIPNQY